MLIPRFWAEGRRQYRERQRQVTVRRFGWSDTSQEEAQAHADQRTEEALGRILAGETLTRRERKQAYDDVGSAPIREEIVGRQGTVVITRNSYGARCLNVADVLIADIDHTDDPTAGVFHVGCAVALGGALVVGLVAHSIVSGVLALLPTFLLGVVVAERLHRLILRWRGGMERGGMERVASGRVEAFVAAHPAWGLRVYRTPAGLRLVATHRTFPPGDPEIDAAFQALGVDPLYARLCRRQQCFRARVSPKPWRTGLEQPVRPYRSWPVPANRLPERQAWVERYEAKSREFAACHLLKTTGPAQVHPAVQPFVALHDELCRATSGLPLA